MEAKPGQAFEALSDAVLAIAAERSVESILQRLVEAVAQSYRVDSPQGLEGDASR